MAMYFDLNPDEYELMYSNEGNNSELERTRKLNDEILRGIKAKKEYDDVLNQFYNEENPVDSDNTKMSNFDYPSFIKDRNDKIRQEDSEVLFSTDGDENEISILDRLSEQKKERDDAIARADADYDYYLRNRDKFQSIEPLSDAVRNGVTMFSDGTMKVLGNVDDVLLGYNPKDDGTAEYVEDEDSIPEAIYFAPFVGDKIYAGKVVKDAVTGKRVPGLLDIGFGLAGLGGLGYGAYRGIKSLRNSRNASRGIKSLPDYSTKAVTGQVFDKDGNVVPWDNFRWSNKPNYGTKFNGRSVYDENGNLIEDWR